jgi:hypothetical protein
VRKGKVFEPSVGCSIAIHPQSLVSFSAMHRMAMALQNIERPRHNGMPIGPLGGQSRRN